MKIILLVIMSAMTALTSLERSISEASESAKGKDAASKHKESRDSAEDLKQAVENLHSAFAHEPKSSTIAIAIAETHFKLGVVYLSEGQPKKALENLRKTLNFYKKVAELSTDEAELLKAKKGAQILQTYLQRYITTASKANSRSAKEKLKGIGSTQNYPYASTEDRYINELQKANDKYKRINAARELAKLGATDAIPVLILALHSDVYKDVRTAAARSLGKLGNRNVTWALAKALRNKREHEDVRAEAAESIGKIGDPRALADLRYALNNSSKRLRERLERIIVDLSNNANPTR